MQKNNEKEKQNTTNPGNLDPEIRLISSEEEKFIKNIIQEILQKQNLSVGDKTEYLTQIYMYIYNQLFKTINKEVTAQLSQKLKELEDIA